MKTSQADKTGNAGEMRFAAIVTAVHFILGLAGILTHEMWRDEYQAWFIAKESGSLAQLFANSAYEGHPKLWFIILFVITRFTADPFWMQLTHLAIASTGVYIFSRYAPFKRHIRVLLPLSYFILYGHSVVARNYAPAIALLFAFCALYNVRKHRFLKLGIILFLMAQTNVLATVIAIALALFLFYQFLFDKKNKEDAGRCPMDFAAGTVLALAGVGIAIVSMIPPPDTGFFQPWIFNFQPDRIAYVVSSFWQGFLPVNFKIQQGYQTTILDKMPFARLNFSVVILLVSIFLIGNRRNALTAYITGIAGLLTFFYIKYPGVLRHHSFVFLYFIACLWLAQDEDPQKGGFLKSFDTILKFFDRRRFKILTGILAIQAASGIFALAVDFYYPFSASKNTAEFIMKKFPGAAVIAHEDYAGIPLAGRLKSKIHYIQADRWGTYIIYNKDRLKKVTMDDFYRTAKNIHRRKNREVLLVLNHTLKKNDLMSYPFDYVKIFRKSRVSDERYAIYRFVPRGEGR